MRTLTITLFNVVFLAAAVLTWPIYRDVRFIILVAIALLLANAVAIVSATRRWSARRVALILAVAYLVLGVPLAIPSGLSSPIAFLQAWLQLFIAPVTAWKDLLTLSLPVGSYQSVLVPALIIYLGVTAVALALALRIRKTALRPFVAGVASVPLLFATLFGSSNTEFTLNIAGFTLPSAGHILLTVLSLLALGFWVAYRPVSRSQTHRSADLPKTRTLSQFRSSGVLTLAATLMVAVSITPTLMADSPRDVLRTRVNPQLVIDTETSPLSLYRAAFSDEMFATPLFETALSADVDRIRIATLSTFDGQVMSVGNDASFSRVPALVSGPPSSELITVTVGALTGIWMPTTANLTGVEFTGERASALSDGFFYNETLQSGVQITNGGLTSGDSYRLSADAEVSSTPELGDLKPGLTSSQIDPALIPDSVGDWIALQRVPNTGAGLETLISRLRARGYLSHALNIDPEAPPAWMQALPNYQFFASRAGHSSARIDQLFSALRDREREVGSGDDTKLVAAPGDDEQFAVAALLLADQLGFNARVVVGTRLGDAPADLAQCTGGSCSGSTLAAWLEVQGESGEWVTVDVTPQAEHPIAPDVERLQDPQVVTQVTPPSVDPVRPSDSLPAQSGANAPEPDPTQLDLSWLWLSLRIATLSILVLLVLFGPMLLIAFLKRLRRKHRRTAAEPKERILGAWNEVVDTEIDAGIELPRGGTRLEVAHSQNRAREEDARPEHSGTIELAHLADRAVFSVEPVSEQAAERAWLLADEHRRELRSHQQWRKRLLSSLSLRSFTRWIRETNR